MPTSLALQLSNWVSSKTSRNAAPMPPSRSLTGHLSEIHHDPISFFMRSREQYGDVIQFRSGPYLCHFIAHPKDIKHVLQDAQKNYTKDAYGFDKTPMFFRSGILLAEGMKWQKKRRAAQPAFSGAQLNQMAPQMIDVTHQIMQNWSSGKPMDFNHALSGISLQIFFQTMLGFHLQGTEKQITKDVAYVVNDLYHRSFNLVDLPLTIPVLRNLAFKKKMKRLLQVSQDAIAEGKKGNSPLLESLQIDSDQPIQDSLVDEILNFFLAGHETTANTLFWALYMMSQHPEYEVQLQEEADRFFEKVPTTSEWKNSEVLKRFSFTKQIILETLRLYPSVWAMGRAPLADDQLGGFDVPKGSTVVISPWVTHRHPDFWGEPNRFLPERFSNAFIRHMDKYAYLPFSNGPRRCIGEQFAMIELVLVLATLVHSWCFKSIYPIEPLPRITLQTKQAPFLIPYKRF